MRTGSGTYSKPPFTGNCRYSCNSTECVSAVSFRCTTRRRRSPDGAESAGKPAVHNLIFVRISPAWLQKIKTAKLIPAKCMYDKTTQMPLIVPDKQMDDFIALTEGKFEDVLLIDPSTEKLERGDMVRITSGMFAGIEGEYIRYRSKNRVVVRIEGFAAVATAEVPETYIEKISAEAHPVGSPV